MAGAGKLNQESVHFVFQRLEIGWVGGWVGGLRGVKRSLKDCLQQLKNDVTFRPSQGLSLQIFYKGMQSFLFSPKKIISFFLPVL